MIIFAYMDVYEFRDSRRLITYAKGITLEEASDLGVEVVYDGELVAYYIEDGFSVLSVPMGRVNGVSMPFLWHVINSLILMNEDRSVEELTDFMYLYLLEFGNRDLYKPDKSRLRGMISDAVENVDYEKCVKHRRFYFLRYLGRELTRTVVMSYINRRKTGERMNKIENIIDWLTIESKKFITATTIKEELDEDLSISTISRYMSIRRSDIDRHNRKVFGTDSFMMYKKMLSIHNIKRAIEVLTVAEEDLSQRKIAKKANLHYNTVNNLWGEKEIQEQLDKYNKLIK